MLNMGKGFDFREFKAKQEKLALEWKSNGGKVVGHYCNYVPEEILHAAGILSIRLLGTTDNITHADAHIQSFVCKLIRAGLDMGLKGELDYMDGMVIPNTCDGMRLLFEIWKKNMDKGFLRLLDLPILIRQGLSQDRMRNDFGLFKRQVEEYFGKLILEEELSNSIRVYNENRTLLKELYNLRRKEEGIISSVEAYEAVLASLTWPKELSSELLKSMIAEANKKIAERKEVKSKPKVRFHVSGSVLTDLRILEIVEEFGGVVISDDLCTGTRYYWDNVEETGDPMKAITNRYIEKLPCPCKSPNDERHDFIFDSIRQGDVHGVIFVMEKYCDPHLFDYPLLRKQIMDMNIPTLGIESELGVSGQEQLRTRIQTFINVVQGGQ